MFQKINLPTFYKKKGPENEVQNVLMLPDSKAKG
jgi:hypothetical protein